MGASIFFTAAMMRVLKARIIAAVKNVWQELEYLIDVCRVTRGAHIELLYL
jgi:hypothetical protein